MTKEELEEATINWRRYHDSGGAYVSLPAWLGLSVDEWDKYVVTGELPE